MPSNSMNRQFDWHRSKRRNPVNLDRTKRDVIVIGASAGGVMALTQLFGGLPANLPASIAVELHRSTVPGELAEVLGRRSAFPLVEPKRQRSSQSRSDLPSPVRLSSVVGPPRSCRSTWPQGAQHQAGD